MQTLNFSPEQPGESRTVLCLGSHSDDIEIGCGGSILRLIQEDPYLRFYWVVLGAQGMREAEARTSAGAFLEGASHAEVVVKGFLGIEGCRGVRLGSLGSILLSTLDGALGFLDVRFHLLDADVEGVELGLVMAIGGHPTDQCTDTDADGSGHDGRYRDAHEGLGTGALSGMGGGVGGLLGSGHGGAVASETATFHLGMQRLEVGTEAIVFIRSLEWGANHAVHDVHQFVVAHLGELE